MRQLGDIVKEVMNGVEQKIKAREDGLHIEGDDAFALAIIENGAAKEHGPEYAEILGIELEKPREDPEYMAIKAIESELLREDR